MNLVVHLGDPPVCGGESFTVPGRTVAVTCVPCRKKAGLNPEVPEDAYPIPGRHVYGVRVRCLDCCRVDNFQLGQYKFSVDGIADAGWARNKLGHFLCPKCKPQDEGLQDD